MSADMTEPQKLVVAAQKAHFYLMEFFKPHMKRRVDYDVELGKMSKEDASYWEELEFDYEDSTDTSYNFTYELDEGYYGVTYISVSFDIDFVNDPEGAEVEHKAEMEAKRQRDIEIENRRIETQIRQAKREVEKLEAKLRKGLK